MDAHLLGTTPGLAAPELAHHAVVDLVPLGAAAARAVLKPTSERAPDAPPPEALTTVDPDAGRKHWLTLQARAALAGFELVCMADGSVVAGRWGKLLVLADLATVEAFLVRAGAPA